MHASPKPRAAIDHAIRIQLRNRAEVLKSSVCTSKMNSWKPPPPNPRVKSSVSSETRKC